MGLWDGIGLCPLQNSLRIHKQQTCFAPLGLGFSSSTFPRAYASGLHCFALPGLVDRIIQSLQNLLEFLILFSIGAAFHELWNCSTAIVVLRVTLAAGERSGLQPRTQ
jgi:hypothetical protein